MNAIVFDAPGYTVTSGWLNAGASGLAVKTNFDATIGSTLSGGGNILTKTGTAALSIVGTNFLGSVVVNEGELKTPNLFFSDVTLANTPGVVLTLTASGDESINSLSGGGASGGVVQPGGTSSLTTVRLWENSNFAGVLQDSGTNKLALTQLYKSGTFAGANTYTGATSASSGAIVFAGNGSALNSGTFSATDGTLRLDNAAVALTNRVGDTTPVVLDGGRLEMIGNSSSPVEETAGVLSFSRASSVSVAPSGSTAALLTFSGASRVAKGTLDVSGSGAVLWSGLANGTNGLVANYITYSGSDWAIVGGSGRIEPLATYNTNLNAMGADDHMKLTGNGTLLATGTCQTLNWQTTNTGTTTLDLAGNTLDLAGAGLLTSGSGAARIQGGTLSAGGGELVVINQNALTIASPIAETNAGMGLTKSGKGMLTLTGTNTYSGNTAIVAGTLGVSSDSNLGTGSAIEFNGGTLKALGSFTSSKNLTRGTSWVGTIDTNGNTVTFSGYNSALSKTGSGTLVLSNTNVGSVSLQQGTVALPNSTTGSVMLSAGILQASGTLTDIYLSGTASVLDIGGTAAATLTIGSFYSFGFGNKLTISFGIGASGKDLWAISGSDGFLSGSSFGTGGIIFDFQDLGGVTTGTSYTLVNLPASNSVTASNFAFSSTSAANGWGGTFSVVSNQVTVTLNSVPEPGTAALFVVAAGLSGLRRRRGNRHC